MIRNESFMMLSKESIEVIRKRSALTGRDSASYQCDKKFRITTRINFNELTYR